MSQPIVLAIDDPQYFSTGYYDDGDPAKRAALEARWKAFSRADPASGQTYQFRYRPTRVQPDVYVAYFMPPTAPPGRYRIEALIPGDHATATRAHFSVAHNFREEAGEAKHDEAAVKINMDVIFDKWTSLGEYDLDPGSHAESGRVHEVSQMWLGAGEPAREISFGPVRWVPIPPKGLPIFDSPVGTPAERAGVYFANNKWVGDWFDLNPFLNWYFVDKKPYGYHTGADLNLPNFADKGKPVYSVAEGVVRFSRSGLGSWGTLVVIRHDNVKVTLPDGTSERRPVYSRYGHVADVSVAEGDVVMRGQQIGTVGAPPGSSAYHLHFDIGYSTVFEDRPAHWPSLAEVKQLIAEVVKESDSRYVLAKAKVYQQVVDNYLDPARVIRENR